MLRKWFFTKVAYSLFKNEAKGYANSKEKTKSLLTKATSKAKKNELTLRGVWGRLQTMFTMLKAWTKGDYREIPYRSLFMILLSVVYFVSPIDVIPDFLFGIGILDDAALIAFVISQVDKDLEAFQQWDENKSNIVEVIVNQPK
ncbi:DUF1232 domain-containing protein [Peribacillus cavernae]|uniref:DUF1232 domain-containing protein n=1 Tax=Peribacillus cavernae TaxID=1674310 RepID=A0A3S0TYC1_9BACI|nr:YkvA family protein [Peribacillus cavernae]MDQ0217292.1 uncharacterized membrane protein YkvA (DUF1232 family) [Peribacillus cavernae]RUQ30242.1 DUF1232 domain-containing protein [Peribacillus cavernae]